MSTVAQPLKYLFIAAFEDGHLFEQPEDDRYSKHVEGAEHNFSSFTDVQDYAKTSPIASFGIEGGGNVVAVNLQTGEWHINGLTYSHNEEDVDGKRKLVYYRIVDWVTVDGVTQDPVIAGYCIGYEYKNSKGKTVKRIITIDG